MTAIEHVEHFIMFVNVCLAAGFVRDISHSSWELFVTVEVVGQILLKYTLDQESGQIIWSLFILKISNLPLFALP